MTCCRSVLLSYLARYTKYGAGVCGEVQHRLKKKIFRSYPPEKRRKNKLPIELVCNFLPPKHVRYQWKAQDAL